MVSLEFKIQPATCICGDQQETVECDSITDTDLPTKRSNAFSTNLFTKGTCMRRECQLDTVPLNVADAGKRSKVHDQSL
jgi:hypothetical protein